jgi:hypothetical protein
MNPTLSNCIIYNQEEAVRHLLLRGVDVNQLDEYGFTPLIEAAIANHVHLAKLLLQHGADPNQKDMVGGTALHWAVENNNLELCQLLLDHQADPNAHNLSGEPLLVKPILREHKVLKHLLYEYGGSTRFANDYIQLKLLGHRYDLKGEIDIVNFDGGFVELSLEGFFLESSTHILRQSLQQYVKNFAAKKNKDYFPVYGQIIEALRRAADLFRFQQYQTNLQEKQAEINALLDHDLIILPVNYDGHAISFIHYQNYWVRCDRQMQGRRMNGIVFFEITRPRALDKDLMKFMLYEKKDIEFINETLNKRLGLKPVARMMIDPQVTGNCSWANMTASVPAAFFLITDKISDYPSGIIDYDHLALQQYRDWRDWDRKNAINYCINNFKTAEPARKATLGAALAAVFFQCIDYRDKKLFDLAREIHALLKEDKYHYLLKNYLDQYYHRRRTPAGINLKKLIEACESYF